MKKKIVCIFFLIILFPVLIHAETKMEYDKLLDEYTELYGDIFENGIDEIDIDGNFKNLTNDINIKEIFSDLVSGKIEISIQELLNIIVKRLSGEIYISLKTMALIVAISVLSSYLTGLQDGFGKEGVNKAAFYACYIVISGIACAAFYDAAECVFKTIEQISLFMKMIVPVVITALVSSGAAISAAVLEPTLIVIVELTVEIIKSCFLPIVMLSTAMNIVNNLSDRFKTERLVKFMNSSIKRGLTIILTIFVSVATLRSIASSGADGLTIKLTKYAAANFIPVVGGVLSESVETVMNCSVLIKNAVGIMGIICVAIISAIPILKIGGVLIIFRLIAAISEPVSDPKTIKCLNELGNSVSVLFSMLTACTVMFILVLTVIINAGNTAVMLGR